MNGLEFIHSPMITTVFEPALADLFGSAREIRAAVERGRMETYDAVCEGLADGHDPVVVLSMYACRLRDELGDWDSESFEVRLAEAHLAAVSAAIDGRPLPELPDLCGPGDFAVGRDLPGVTPEFHRGVIEAMNRHARGDVQAPDPFSY